MKITINKIKHENKVGNNSGKTFESCQINTTNSKGESIWISGFGSEVTHTWNDGDEVDVTIEQNGQYWNFKLNDDSKSSPDKKLLLLEEINKKLDMLIDGHKLSVPEVGPTAEQAPPVEEEIQVDSIPF